MDYNNNSYLKSSIYLFLFSLQIVYKHLRGNDFKSSLYALFCCHARYLWVELTLSIFLVLLPCFTM
jgi:hypothetical protein